MTRAVDMQRNKDRRPHTIASAHFPRGVTIPGWATCQCGVTVEAFQRLGSVFEDPWKPLADEWLAHRASVGAPKTSHSGQYGDGSASPFLRDNSTPPPRMTKTEAGRLGAAAGPDFLITATHSRKGAA